MVLHCKSSFLIRIDLFNVGDGDDRLIKDRHIITQGWILPRIGPADEYDSDAHEELRCSLLTFDVYFASQLLCKILPKLFTVFREFRRNGMSQFFLCLCKYRGIYRMFEGNVVFSVLSGTSRV